MKCDILVFAAHPDDAELNCGGTIARFKSEGRTVAVCDLTLGEMGTRGTTESRRLEVNRATEILGIDHRVQLDLGDSKLDNTRENQSAIISVVRDIQPKLCVTGAPDDRHPDHRKATDLVKDALFYSGLIKWQTVDKNGKPQQPWRPQHIIQYMQDRPFEPDFIMDISDFWELKARSVLAFDTQFNVEDPGQEPETYISSSTYFKQLEARARYFGHLGGFEFGEPFRYLNGPMGLPDSSVFFGYHRKS